MVGKTEMNGRGSAQVTSKKRRDYSDPALIHISSLA
jgi:hypothetical protein